MNIFSFNEQPGRTAYIKGQEYLFFSGYSYLGMQHVPEFITLIKEGVDKYGWLFPSSRISNTTLLLYEECEALLSSITGMEDTLLVSSGYMAGRLATALWHKEVTNLDPSHPAIQRLKTIERSRKIFALDSVNVLTANIIDFSFLKPTNKQQIVIIDDSHGIGLIGKNGEGICNKCPAYRNTLYVLSYSLSKAWNINGGAVSCSKHIVDSLRKLPAYTAATPPSPAMLYAFIKGQHLYQVQRKKLKSNIKYFQDLIKDIKQIVYHPELPVFILPTDIDEDKLLEKNIIISSFAYPDPHGAGYRRIVINALHNFADLEQLAYCLKKIIV